DRLQPLLEVAAIARAGEQGAHVERVDGRALEHVGDVTLDDLAREPFRDRGFADARVADVERVVLRPATEDLHRAVDLGHPPDERIDLAVARLLVEVDGELLERGFLLAAALLLRLLLGAFGRTRLGGGLTLADAVADVGHGVEAAHVLLLEEIDGIALALREEGDQDVRAGDFVAARGLDVEDRALDHALEAAGRRRVGGAVGDKRAELIVQILLHRRAQFVAADPAGGHHLRGMFVVDQRNQKVLEGRILVPALAGLPQGIVEGLFEFASETRHLDGHSPPAEEPTGLAKTMSYERKAQSRGAAPLIPSLSERMRERAVNPASEWTIHAGREFAAVRQACRYGHSARLSVVAISDRANRCEAYCPVQFQRVLSPSGSVLVS